MNIPGYRLPIPPPAPPCCGRAPNPLLPGTLQWPLPLLKEWFNSRADALVDMALERISVGSGFYRLPDGGIPLLDLSNEVRTVLGNKADKATTLAGYGITDAYTQTETDGAISAAISAVKDSAPEAFDTLKEIADWIGDDQTGAAAMAARISSHTSQLSQLSQNKVDKVAGKGLSTNDYTNADKTKVDALGTASAKDVPASGNAATGQVVMGSDSRLSDARTPTAHKSSHATGGADALSPADIGAAQASHTHSQSDVTGLADALAGKREKGDLAVYKKVGVGDTWTLVSNQGEPVVTTEATGEYNGNGWSFYVNGELVAAADAGLETDYEGVVWRGAPEIGLAGTAHRPWKYQSVDGDGLAKTSYVDGRTVLTPVYSQTPTFSEWALSPEPPASRTFIIEWSNGTWELIVDGASIADNIIPGAGQSAVYLEFQGDILGLSTNLVATRVRTDIIGYTLGSQTTKPLQPQGEYAPATNIPKTALASGVQTSLGLADTAVQPSALAGYATTAQLAQKADASALRYDLGTEIAISSASSEVVEGETVTYGEATLADRTANRVAITAAIAELRLAFPAAVSGKVRDFGLRVEVGTGSAALTAPSLVPPAGVTLENADGAIPALADGAADAKGMTLLYFSETSPDVFLVKGEQVKEA